MATYNRTNVINPIPNPYSGYKELEGVYGSDLFRRGMAIDAYNKAGGAPAFEKNVRSQAGITADQLTPELRAQLNQLVGYAKEGRTYKIDDAKAGFINTAPIAVAQSSRIDPYSQAGTTALEQQMALLGLRGNDAMNAAMNAAYNENPAQQFTRAQNEKALIRNRAVTGGLGDEGVSEALTRLNSGLTNQNIQQQLQQLGLLSGRGQEAAYKQSDIAGGQIADSLGIRAQSKEARARANAAGSGLNKLSMATQALNLGANFFPALAPLAIGTNVAGAFGGGQPDPNQVIGMNREQFNTAYGY